MARLAESTAAFFHADEHRHHGFINFLTEEGARKAHAALNCLEYPLNHVQANSRQSDSKRTEKKRTSSEVTTTPAPEPVTTRPPPPPPPTETHGHLAAGIHPIAVLDVSSSAPVQVHLGVASLGLYLRRIWLPTNPALAAVLQLADDNLSISFVGTVAIAASPQKIQETLIQSLKTACAPLTEIRYVFAPVLTTAKHLLVRKCAQAISSSYAAATGCCVMERPAAVNGYVSMEFSCVVNTTDTATRSAVAQQLQLLGSKLNLTAHPFPGCIPLTEETKKAVEEGNGTLVQLADGSLQLYTVFDEDVPTVASKLKPFVAAATAAQVPQISLV